LISPLDNFNLGELQEENMKLQDGNHSNFLAVREFSLMVRGEPKFYVKHCRVAY